MTPASAATLAASSATAIRAGSATVVAETQTEGEGQQYENASPACEALSKGVTEREEAAFKSLDEEGEPNHHADQTDDDVPEVGEGLLQDHDLKERDNGDDRRKVTKRAEDPVEHCSQEPGHALLLAPSNHSLIAEQYKVRFGMGQVGENFA